MNIVLTVCLRAVGGEVGATSSLAPKIGPLGLVSLWTEYLYLNAVIRSVEVLKVLCHYYGLLPRMSPHMPTL